MRRITQFSSIGTAIIMVLSLLVVSGQKLVQADNAQAPSLVISQLKITSSNGQFITLYNPGTTALDMSKYQLEYFNSYDLTKATSNRLISLSGTVPPHGYFMVNDDAVQLCYQLVVDSVSLGLSSTAGMIELVGLNQTTPGGSTTTTIQDYVSWSKTAASGAQTLPAPTNAWLQRQPVDSANNPSISLAGIGSWQAVQPSATNNCLATVVANPAQTITSGATQLLPGTEPAASIISTDGGGVTASSDTTTGLPTDDIGLMAPVLTELLPNPAGSGNDDSDEFIELYNPNQTDFDLSDFKLLAGSTLSHSYVFPAGTMLAPQSFTAFYSKQTKLSLSNSGGQVKLIDPLGNSLSATASYGVAADGQAWALANGKWYWTTKLTPNSSNVIIAPPAKTNHTGTGKQTAKSKLAKSKKAKSTKKAKSSKHKKHKTKTTAAALTSDTTVAPPSTPIHKLVLALIAGLALLYAAYEYRADIKNYLYKFGRHARHRR